MSTDRDPDRPAGAPTIVGGRPMHRAVAVSELPVGIEQVLTIAGLNHEFRSRLQDDPQTAASSIGVELDETELALLRSVSPEQLAGMARRTLPQPDTGRRRFIRNVAASVVALVAGDAFLLCSGCTGADGWEPDFRNPDLKATPDQSPDLAPAVNKMATLAGHLCYIYVPAGAAPPDQWALLVALHDSRESCVANIKRWSKVADHERFCVVSVNWTEAPTTKAQQDKLADDLSEIVGAFELLYPVDPTRRHLTSRGASTPIAHRAAFLQDPGFWASCVFLGGVPVEGECRHGRSVAAPKGLVDDPPALFYLMGQKDKDYGKMNQCFKMLTFYGVPTRLELVDGTTLSAVLKFGDIWAWMKGFTA